MASISLSISRGNDGFRQDALTTGTLAPNANDMEFRFNVTDANAKTLTRKDLIIALDAFKRAAIGLLQEATLPENANLLNVRNFGAVGDGINDDTAAIMAAVAAIPDWSLSFPYLTQPLYFPAGTYLISSPIQRTSKGTLSPDWWPGLVLIGAGQGVTTIKMKDASFGFNAGINTTGPFGSTTGFSVFAFNNTIQDLTVDCGNNPSATGISFESSNMGVIRNATVQTSHPTSIGIWALTGPNLLTNVTVNGPFSIGLEMGGWTGPGNWIYNATINGATQYGLRNTMEMTAFDTLTITMAGAGGYAFGNNDPPNGPGVIEPWMFHNEGLLTGIRGVVSGTGIGNIQSSASYNFKNVSSTLNSVPLSLDGVFHGSTPVTKTGDWALTVTDTPASVNTPIAQWVRVHVTPGFNTTTVQDITAAFQAALNTVGASVIYVPCGYYSLSGTLTVPDNIDRIDAFYSNFETHSVVPYYIFTVNPTRTKNLEITRFCHQIFQTINGLINWTPPPPASLVLRDTTGYSYAVVTSSGAGSVFGENVVWAHLSLTSSAQCWFRHLDMETTAATDAIDNVGTNLWILGHKTEGHEIKINASGSANTEVVGGLYYLNSNQPPSEATQFVMLNSRIAASYVQDCAATPKSYADQQFDVTLSGVETIVFFDAFPARNPEGGPMAAWYSTDALPVTTVFLNKSLPRIGGIHVGTGHVLTATNGIWYIANTPEGSPRPTSFTYQWYRGGVSIGGATNSTYTSAVADLGLNLTVGVKAHNAIGTSLEAISPPFNITATYIGPGDVISGWNAWYGLRGFSAAYSTGSNPAVDLVSDTSGSNLVTINILAVGDLDVASINTWVTANSVSTIYVKKIYDQSGNGHHLTQAVGNNWPTLLLNTVNGNTLAAMNLTTTLGGGATSSFTTATGPPCAVSLVAQSTAVPGISDSYFMLISGTGQIIQVGPNTDGTTWNFYNGTPAVNFNAANSVLHAVNATMDAAFNVNVNIDGTTATGTTGSRDITAATNIDMGFYGPFGTTSSGYICEVGLRISAVAFPQSSMRTNQSLYWGTP